MKNLKSILVSGLLALGAFGTLTFTSCNQDECKDVVCNNGGTCNEEDGSCLCASGYEGDLCETLSRFRFLNSGTTATYITGIGQDGCYAAGYTMTINPGANGDEIIINNFAGYGNSATVSGVKVDGTNFSKAGTITAGSVTLSNINGTVSENGQTISFSYTATDNNTSINCTSASTKQ